MGVGWDYFTPEGIEFWGKINFLKAGIVYADLINTVSAKYAQEITTPEFGFGLDGVLRTRRDNLFGIVNGIDTDIWNPGNGHLHHETVRARDARRIRSRIRRTLLDAFYLPQKEETPLIGIISRLADQKGFRHPGRGNGRDHGNGSDDSRAWDR